MLKLRSSLLAAAVAAVCLAQTAGDLETPAVNRIAEKMNCSCGCMLNMACRMDPYPCPVCRRAKVKIYEMQGAGKSDREVFDAFVAENGKQVLAVGPGFMGVAGIWAAALIGLGVVLLAIRRFLRPQPATAAAETPEIDPETMARIEKDLNKLD